jgi:homeobox protein cut-like
VESLPLPLPLMLSASGGRIPKSDPLEGALQDMLRLNMERCAGQTLDTIGSARRVRELLSVHNIGQRLFAKYVLGLSQGTVSELLSKPKSWEKLTEKGRDSYRKMHAWAYDEQAVMLLKTLIPRKSELSRPPSRVQPPHAFEAFEEEERADVDGPPQKKIKHGPSSNGAAQVRKALEL